MASAGVDRISRRPCPFADCFCGAFVAEDVALGGGAGRVDSEVFGAAAGGDAFCASVAAAGGRSTVVDVTGGLRAAIGVAGAVRLERRRHAYPPAKQIATKIS